jgi:hypothetical protein
LSAFAKASADGSAPAESVSAGNPGDGPARRSSPAASEGGGAEDEAARAWPGESDEAAYLAAAGEDADSSAPEFSPDGGPGPAFAERGPARTPAAGEGAGEAELPPLEELVERVPAEVRAALDELFRAKFVAVRRLSRRAPSR